MQKCLCRDSSEVLRNEGKMPLVYMILGIYEPKCVFSYKKI